MTKEIKTESKMAKTEDRKSRKKVYERVREGALPPELEEHFKKDNYDLKLVRFLTQGEEDYRYLYVREREGYEFVSPEEIPAEFMNGLNILNTKTHQGLVTMSDLCLMKIDSDLRNSRRKFFQDETDRHVNAVDMHVLEKKGFRNLGTKSRLMTREPSFQE